MTSIFLAERWSRVGDTVSAINCQLASLAAQNIQKKICCVVLKASEEEKKDAADCGVELILPCLNEDIKDAFGNDEPSFKWLLSLEQYFLTLTMQQNIEYIVEHIKSSTSFLFASALRKSCFKDADIVLINHVIPSADLRDRHLKFAEAAAAVFSVGPTVFEEYAKLYQMTKIQIKHELYLPRPAKAFFDLNVDQMSKTSDLKQILTLITDKKVESKRFKVLSAAVGKTAEGFQSMYAKIPKWFVRTTSAVDLHDTQSFLTDNLDCTCMELKTYPAFDSQDEIYRDLKQSNVLVIPPDEPFRMEALWAIAAGLPVLVPRRTAMAEFLVKYFNERAEYFLYEPSVDDLSQQISKMLLSPKATGESGNLKDSFQSHTEIDRSHETFTACLTKSPLLGAGSGRISPDEASTSQAKKMVVKERKLPLMPSSGRISPDEASTSQAKKMVVKERKLPLMPTIKFEANIELQETTMKKESANLTEEQRQQLELQKEKYKPWSKHKVMEKLQHEIIELYEQQKKRIMARNSPNLDKELDEAYDKFKARLDLIRVSGRKNSQRFDKEVSPAVSHPHGHSTDDGVGVLEDRSFNQLFSPQPESPPVFPGEASTSQAAVIKQEGSLMQVTGDMSLTHSHLTDDSIGSNENAQSQHSPSLQQVISESFVFQEDIPTIHSAKDTPDIQQGLQLMSNLKVQLLTVEAERLILQSQLKGERKEKAVLEEQCLELRQQLEKTRNQSIQDKYPLVKKQDTESTSSKPENVEDTSVHQKQKAMISKLLESMEKSYIATSLYEKDNIKEQRSLILLAADDETRFYQLPSGFNLEVPPFAVEEDSELVVSCHSENRPPLQDFQCYQSDVLDFKTNDAKFKRPLYLSRKHLNVDPLTRVQIVLMSKTGDKWEELKNIENWDAKSTRVEVTHFSKVIAISEPYRDTFSVSKNSEIFVCKRNEQIQLEIPEDAVHDTQLVTLEVHECGYNTIDTAISTGGEAFDVSFGSIIYLNRKMAEHLTFKKDVTLSVPLPQPIPGVHPSNTELCVFKDEADNDEWQNITENCSLDIENDMLKVKIKSISGYVVGRYIKNIMPRMCNLLSKITKFKKSGQQMVQIILLQDKAVDTRLQCHLMEDRGREIEDLLKSDEYSAFKNHTYWSNILMTSGDVITNTVTGDFKLRSIINKYTYYPYRDNHWDAVVEPKDTCQKSVMIGQMLFSRKEENLAELTFTTQSERLVTEDKIERDFTSLSDLNCLFIDMERALKKDQERELRGLLRGDKVPPRQLQNMQGPLEIFEYLLDSNHIEKGNLKLLEEVYHKIGNNTLVRMVKDYHQCVRSRFSKKRKRSDVDD